MREVDPEIRDAARGMGLSGGQLLWRVELPLAVPYLAAGLRTAAVQVVATAALAAFVNGGGLGKIIAPGSGSAWPPAAARSSRAGCWSALARSGWSSGVPARCAVAAPASTPPTSCGVPAGPEPSRAERGRSRSPVTIR